MKPHLEEVSMTVTQADIDIYAELTDDFNPLHVDREFAAKTPMGGTIAHGTLSVNLIWQSLARTFGADALEHVDLDIRFLKPLFADSTVTAGGRRVPDSPDTFEVWVNGPDGSSLITGQARVVRESVSASARPWPD